jgi:flagellar hook-length control protein FliK
MAAALGMTPDDTSVGPFDAETRAASAIPSAGTTKGMRFGSDLGPAIAAGAKTPLFQASAYGRSLDATLIPGAGNAAFDSLLTAAASSPATSAPAEVPDVPSQVVRAVAMQWKQGVGEARLQLRPEHLGEVTVTLRVEQGSVLATVRAESQAAIDLIRGRQLELQSALAAQGLDLDHLVIDLDPDQRRERPSDQRPAQPQPSRRQAAGGPSFEVVV